MRSNPYIIYLFIGLSAAIWFYFNYYWQSNSDENNQSQKSIDDKLRREAVLQIKEIINQIKATKTLSQFDLQVLENLITTHKINPEEYCTDAEATKELVRKALQRDNLIQCLAALSQGAINYEEAIPEVFEAIEENSPDFDDLIPTAEQVAIYRRNGRRAALFNDLNSFRDCANNVIDSVFLFDESLGKIEDTDEIRLELTEEEISFMGFCRQISEKIERQRQEEDSKDNQSKQA